MTSLRRHRILLPLIILDLLILMLAPATACAQFAPGDQVRLKASSTLGVPLHEEAGQTAVSARLPDGSIATVVKVASDGAWLQIQSGTTSGWVLAKYLQKASAPAGPSPVAEADPNAASSYVVGCWNLEWFDDAKTRGFPEDTEGGPTYPPRTQQNYEYIASIIQQIEAKILVLEEINGHEVNGGDEPTSRSKELDRLLGILGKARYDYIIGATGQQQRVAMLFDKQAVRLNEHGEMHLPNSNVNGSSLFAREPLVAHFTFMQHGQAMNDLAVVGVHLASGQSKTKNHDKAMVAILKEIDKARHDEWVIPKDENDVLIAGDFNCNRFDSYKEAFWDDAEHGAWDVLAADTNSYPVTRLSGVPLAPESSRIDYIIVSKSPKGLAGQEITANVATVHTELLSDVAKPEDFRRQASDHLPVTVNVKVMQDDD